MRAGFAVLRRGPQEAEQAGREWECRGDRHRANRRT